MKKIGESEDLDFETQKLKEKEECVCDNNNHPQPTEDDFQGIGTIYGVLLIVFLLIIYKAVMIIDSILPHALTVPEEKLYPSSFIAERAIENLKSLTDIGPRVVGTSENEDLAVNFFLREIMIIIEEAHPNQVVDYDVQTVTGSYLLNFNVYSTISAYSNIQNVIVRLSSNKSSEHSLLVNSHYDSTPTSPGATDAGINCVTMLEVLRKLSRSEKQLEHNVIFLFNGAEETLLQASYAFITQHKWAKEVGVVVNLEGSGAGGKSIMFQAGPAWPWLLRYYRESPYPNAQTVGEELFQNNIIPSDSDFRIFRDFGNAIGMDFAFTKHSYRYHTKYDAFLAIPPGSYQHVGENSLTLIRSLADAPELSKPQAQDKGETTFFDYLGLFFVWYTHETATILHITTTFVSLFLVFKNIFDCRLGFTCASITYLILTISAILLGWISSALLVYLISWVLDTLQFTMSWYNKPWIILGLYVTPITICCCGYLITLNGFYKNKLLSTSDQAQMQAHLLRFIWTIILLIGTYYKIRSVYVIFIPVLFQTITIGIMQLFGVRYSALAWKIIYIIGTIIPGLLVVKLAKFIVSIIIETSGRQGSNTNPEITIAFFTLLATVLITSHYVPLITLLRKPTSLILILSIVFMMVSMIVFTPLGFPYSANPDFPTPQRFNIYHSRRIIRNDTNHICKHDAGFVLLNLDRNSPGSVSLYVKELAKAESVDEDCKSSIYCGLPTPFTRVNSIPQVATWVPAEQPTLHEDPTLVLNSKIKINPTITRFSFTVTGPSQIQLYISPRHGVHLIRTNLIDKDSIPKFQAEAKIWNNRPVYGILHIWGKKNKSLKFFVDFKTPVNWTEPSIDVALIGFEKDTKSLIISPHFSKFLSDFPTWADVIPYISSYESWVY